MINISSDTNIWIVFSSLNHLDWPFRLEAIFFMESEAMDIEIRSPASLLPQLEKLGLHRIHMSIEEMAKAIELIPKHPRLSLYDVHALVLAKTREMLLLTNDKWLRKAAEQEGVVCHGILWLLLELFKKGKITKEEVIPVLTNIRKRPQEYRISEPLVDQTIEEIRLF